MSDQYSPLHNEHLSAFRSVPQTGVLYVMNEAKKLGFMENRSEWANFGQGQPETGLLPGETKLWASELDWSFDEHTMEYSSVEGLLDLRKAVAHYYNVLYRPNKKSQYTHENVMIAPGGRPSLTRAIAALGPINLGHFLPDYTAYEELLDIFKNINPIPILLDAEKKYEFTLAQLDREITGRGLSAILFSNPCNPTGKVIAKGELCEWIKLATKRSCYLLMDEFYSKYIWDDSQVNGHGVSGAEYIEDVNADQVLLFDGLTKNWRMPGARISWVLGPKNIIHALSATGSFLDGGASNPLQKIIVPLLDPARSLIQTATLQKHFKIKREILINALKKLPIEVDNVPKGTFYVWAKLKEGHYSNSFDFFQKALSKKLITVPGEFFDVNPGHRRSRHNCRFQNHMRLSFGPSLEEIQLGITKLEQLF